MVSGGCKQHNKNKSSIEGESHRGASLNIINGQGDIWQKSKRKRESKPC